MTIRLAREIVVAAAIGALPFLAAAQPINDGATGVWPLQGSGK